MPLAVFELACVSVVALTLFAMRRARGPSDLFRDYAALAVAAWIGEDTCIAFYRFYAYAPGWHLRVHHVPVLVPLIWPLVILSARDVVAALWTENATENATESARPPSARRPVAVLVAAAVAALVAFDASLVEVVAVRAGLWSWAEPGHLGVPVIGILGWGWFAAGAVVALSRNRPFLALVLAPLTAHAIIVASWWGIFRWTIRGALGTAPIAAVVLIGAIAVVIVVIGRVRRGAVIPFEVAAPRMIAAALFIALLVSTAPSDVPLWIHATSVAVPYLAATAWPFTGTR